MSDATVTRLISKRDSASERHHRYTKEQDKRDMPPRVARAYHVQVKTHKLTIMLSSLQPTMSIAEIKAETLAALQADVAADALDPMSMEPPELHLETVDDFELCRGTRNKGQLTGDFEVLEPTKLLRETGLGGWEAIFLQPRDQNTKELLPIKYTLPSMYDDDEDSQAQAPATTASNPPEPIEPTLANKGKRKAPPDDEYDEVISVEA